MFQAFSRSKSLDGIIVNLEQVIEVTKDYFDDELTAQLHVAKSWLSEASVTIREHEVQRLRLAHEIDMFSKAQR